MVVSTFRIDSGQLNFGNVYAKKLIKALFFAPQARSMIFLRFVNGINARGIIYLLHFFQACL